MGCDRVKQNVQLSQTQAMQHYLKQTAGAVSRRALGLVINRGEMNEGGMWCDDDEGHMQRYQWSTLDGRAGGGNVSPEGTSVLCISGCAACMFSALRFVRNGKYEKINR
jgi:hypothetical protein